MPVSLKQIALRYMQRRAVFRDADLSGASFLNARLYGIHAERAIFDHVVFMGADLTKSNLTGASLSGAKYWLTNLSSSLLGDSDFHNAIMGVTTFANTDLSSAKGLETVTFSAPVSIAADVIFLSKGQIPRQFLQRSGIPDILVEYIPSLTDTPLEFYSCFISYSNENEVFCDQLVDGLEASGVRCWRWKEDVRMGHDLWAGLDKGIQINDKPVIICSKSSLIAPGVLRELERAIQKEDDLARKGNPQEVLFPIRIDNYVFDEWDHPRKADVRKKHIGDFTDWKDPVTYASRLRNMIDAPKR